MKKALALLVTTALSVLAQVPKPSGSGGGSGGGGSVTVNAPASGSEVVKNGTGSSFDQRGVVGGTGIICTQGTDTITCTTDSAIIPTWESGASSPSSNCTAGAAFAINTTTRETWDCVATNVWARRSGNVFSAVDTGGDDTYAPTTCAGFPAAYASGQTVILQATTANTGAATLDCGPGAKAIKLVDGTTDPANGNITSKQPAILQYDSAADGGTGAWLLLVSSGGLSAADVSGVNTGTSTTTAVTPDSLAGSVFGQVVMQALVTADFTTDTTTGDGKFYFVVPAKANGMNLVSVHAQVITAGTTNTTDVQFARCAVTTSGNACSGTVSDMLSTKLTIDSGENSSADAASAAVINGSNDDVVTNQLIRVDVDAVSTTAAKGLIVTLVFQLP